MSNRIANGNWWAGFLTTLVEFLSYPLLFARFPITRDVPWVNFLLFVIALAFFYRGVKQTSCRSTSWRSGIVKTVLLVVSLAAIGLFCFMIFY
jgi:hypothetical protein